MLQETAIPNQPNVNKLEGLYSIKNPLLQKLHTAIVVHSVKLFSPFIPRVSRAAMLHHFAGEILRTTTTTTTDNTSTITAFISITPIAIRQQ
ncbi:hypothetical protein L6452_35415 [Arctium lappa]|uniref:Uncharacterized protein n=1 Tax=Arctium lappa TaxID=4217 RepID=A0ACB8Y6W6_ARCLA|nr:hypothetical protein L6452_35415 [Arctium lappa]